MTRYHAIAALSLLLAACGSPPARPAAGGTVSGSVALPISTGLSSQALTFREGDISFTRLGAATVQSDGTYDYLRAQYQLTNVGTQPIANLSLVAVARTGNVGDTAIRTISDFGGATGGAQGSVATQTLPVHSVTVDAGGNLSLITGAADFQAFTTAEIAALPGQTGWTSRFGAGDTPLNYGFVARACSGSPCTPTGTRSVAPGGSALVNVALRIPHGSTTAYNFVMNFALVDQDTARVTRSQVPPESAVAAATRLTEVGVSSGGEVMQITTGSAGASGRTDLTVPGLTLTGSGAYTQILTFGANPGPLTANGATGQASATSTNPGGVAVTYGTSTPGICTVSAAGVITPLAAGNCVVTANQAGGTNGAQTFTAAPQVQQTVTVNAGPTSVLINAATGSVSINGTPLASNGTFAFVSGASYAITLSIPASLSPSTPAFGPKLTGLSNLGTDDSWTNVIAGLVPKQAFNVYNNTTRAWKCYDYDSVALKFSGLLSYTDARTSLSSSTPDYNSLLSGSTRTDAASTARSYLLSTGEWFTSAAEWATFNPTATAQNLTVKCNQPG